ncbi:MAG: hypothetical protein QF704_09595, partial [Anaerolineales bacterium]|nr:hypothetical protein [Anaerolineales bacterium]
VTKNQTRNINANKEIYGPPLINLIALTRTGVLSKTTLAMEIPSDGNIIPTIQLFEYGKKDNQELDPPLALSDWCNRENTNGRNITARPTIFIVLLIIKLKYIIYTNCIDSLLRY